MTFNYNIFSLEWSRSVSLHFSCVGLQVFSNCPFGWLALCHSQMSLHDYKEAEKSAQKGTAYMASKNKYHTIPSSIYIYIYIYISKPCNLRNVKTGSKNVQFVRQHCCKTSRIATFCLFPPTNQTCLATNQVVACYEKLLQEVESSSTFRIKLCICCAFYRPQGKLATSNITPIYGVASV